MNKNIKKDIHNIHDKSYKDLYSKKEIAIDLFKSLLKVDWVKNITPNDLTLINKSFVTTDYDDTECDIVYKANINNTEVIFYILLEFQSTIDYRMPLRLLFYMCEILRDYVKNEKHNKYDKNLKIPAVIPIVLYNGEKVWDVPNEFRKIIYNENLFGNGILNFKYDVFDVNNNFSKEELLNSKNVTAAIFLLDQKIDALEFLQRIKAIALFFDALTETEMRAIKHWIKNTVEEKLAESSIKILECNKEDVEFMIANNAFILTEMKEKAIQEGMQKGLQEGIQQGMQQGIQQGMQQGIQQGVEKGSEQKEIEIILNMLSQDLNEELISNLTKIEINKIKEIRDKYTN
ncbi:MAG: Rpn family recombination-promoting nuclease/putative transposase [Romboutsia sp.]|uniref:Rpn family recombination-promoting nuclease/putative transposase n=1 Tax=Romboutsia sp. TaxID=1965302 RepID=UPI003F3E9AD3